MHLQQETSYSHVDTTTDKGHAVESRSNAHETKADNLAELTKQCPSSHEECMNGEIIWFAMSAPYRRELKAKAFLESKGIECFVPMKNAIVDKRNGIKSRQLVPAIHNLIFVHTSKSTIQELKRGRDFLQYMTRPQDGKNTPITIPDKQMSQFIAATNTTNEELIYLRPEEIDLKKGAKVRVHGGAFDGMEGTFMKVQGKRNRRVVILVESVAAVALAEISPDLIEIIK